MSKRLFFAIMLAAVFPLIGCSTYDIGDKPGGEQLEEAKMAPQFDLPDLDGNEMALADLEGEKVYLKFWASWCSICLAGLDELDTLTGKDTPYLVITIASPGYNGEKSTEAFKEWFSGLDINHMTVLLDEGGTWAEQYDVLTYPTSAYIGSDGSLAATVAGHQPNEQIKRMMGDIH